LSIAAIRLDYLISSVGINSLSVWMLKVLTRKRNGSAVPTGGLHSVDMCAGMKPRRRKELLSGCLPQAPADISVQSSTHLAPVLLSTTAVWQFRRSATGLNSLYSHIRFAAQQLQPSFWPLLVFLPVPAPNGVGGASQPGYHQQLVYRFAGVFAPLAVHCPAASRYCTISNYKVTNGIRAGAIKREFYKIRLAGPVYQRGLIFMNCWCSCRLMLMIAI
jgi:hypothetical protein